MALRLVVLLVFVSQAISACSPRPPSPAPAGTGAAQPPPTAIPSPTIVPGGGATGCYYVWATRELPELAEKLQAELAVEDPRIRAGAYAFGEDCRREDGTVTFLPMETDFRVQIPVQSLADEGVLGDWISRVMLIVDAIPADELSGPRPGRAEFEFQVDGSDSLRINVELSRYRAEARGLAGAELFRFFLPKP